MIEWLADNWYWGLLGWVVLVVIIIFSFDKIIKLNKKTKGGEK